jgi:(2Fe-2S) ferredoxin
MPAHRKHLFICTDTDCASKRGSKEIHKAFLREIRDRDLADDIRVNATNCLDGCGFGPNMVVYPDGVFYYGVRPEDVGEIVESHLIGGKVVERLTSHGDG